jgi:hypothetical protein
MKPIHIVLCASLHCSVAFADMSKDSPITFPEKGALPALYPPDVNAKSFPSEKDYYLFQTPCRSLKQINEIQAKMPSGGFKAPPADWKNLSRTRRVLNEGSTLRIFGLGDSIVNDTMRSGLLAKLGEAYPKTKIEGMALVRGSGGCQHYKDENRIEKYVAPHRPDFVLIGGISQKNIEDIRTVIKQLRAALPDVEILLATGAFGSYDPRDENKLAQAPHSGTGAYGAALKQLAADEKCAFLDMTSPWAQYIRSSQKHPHVFYRDVVHANEYGEQILSKILLSFFAPDTAKP